MGDSFAVLPFFAELIQRAPETLGQETPGRMNEEFDDEVVQVWPILTNLRKLSVAQQDGQLWSSHSQVDPETALAGAGPEVN